MLDSTFGVQSASQLSYFLIFASFLILYYYSHFVAELRGSSLPKGTTK